MRPGEIVATNVRLSRLLSEGGMGSVWVADHLTLSTEVAVKFMTAEMAEQPEALARFKREASASAQVKSPHIVQVFDHGLTADNIPYIVMELLHGEDLDARLSRGPLSLGETLEVTRQVCKALGRAHQAGVVHRDIKPANIFLTDVDGETFVKVLDFGIAKRTIDDAKSTKMTRNGAMLGTPLYMSPEQILGSADIDARSDLWAVGVVAYNCITGVTPFDGETVGALSIAINAAVFTPPSALVAVPPAVDAWFARALARAPAARFSTAKEMSDALDAAIPRDQRSRRPPALGALATTTASTSPMSTADTVFAEAQPVVAPARRRSGAVFAVAAGLVVVGVSIAVYASAMHKPAAASAGEISPMASAPLVAPAPASGAPSAAPAPEAMSIVAVTASTPVASSPPAPSSAPNGSRRVITKTTVAPTPPPATTHPPPTPPSVKDRGF